MNRADLRAALSHPNVAAFLRVIRQGESGQGEDAYTIQYGGKHFAAPPWAHPRERITAGRWTSTAAGAYQFLAGTWDALVARYAFPDFSPACQDEAAVALIHGRKALADVEAGRLDAALAKCGKEWASLPGSPYGQPVMTLEEARETYERWGGRYEAPPSAITETEPADGLIDPPKEEPMAIPLAPIAIAAAQAFLPRLIDMIPALGAAFGSGSEVQKRNVAAATMVAKAVTDTLGEPNLQAALERMEADPEALAQVRQVVTELVPMLMEAGGGGIEGARKAAASPEQTPPWKNPAVWFMGAFIPLIYGAAWLVLTGDFSQDARMMVVTAIFTGLLASGTAFFLGSSLGSQRKTTMLTGKE